MIRRNVSSSGKVDISLLKDMVSECISKMELGDERGATLVPGKSENDLISQIKEILGELVGEDKSWFKETWYPIISMVGGVLPWKSEGKGKGKTVKIERRSDVFKRVLKKSLPSDFKGIVGYMVSEWEKISGKRLQGEMEDFTRKSLQTLESWEIVKKDKSGKWEIV